MEAYTLVILTSVAFFAAFFDAIAGGGGLITIPALFLAGLDPVSALATNKFQATAGSTSATIAFARKGMLEWREGKFLILAGLLGGAGGAFFATTVDRQLLEASVPILLLVVATYFIFAPRLDVEGRPQGLSLLVFSFTVAPVISFYDGVFGPGTGSFFMVGFVMLCGLGIMRAMAFTKLANASSNLGALLFFITKGVIVWPLAITMALAAFIGAQLGARCAVRVGPRLVKPMLITVCCVLALKLLTTETNPLRVALLRLF